jgi:carbamoyl-phosphate synthase large subunit
MIGRKLQDLGFVREPRVSHLAIKKSVFPFNRFPGVDIILGPEMKSTGEVMGIDDEFGMAFAKAHMSASQDLPLEGRVFLSVVDRDKKYLPSIAKDLLDLGFKLVASMGTRKYLLAAGIQNVEEVQKIATGEPNVVTLLDEGKVQLVINTPTGRGAHLDEGKIRERTITLNVPCITTIPAARAAVSGIRALKSRDFRVRALQDYFPQKSP